MTMCGVCDDCGHQQKETNPPCAKCGSGNVQETDMDKQAELEQAYWNGFRTKCAEYGVDAEAFTKTAARYDQVKRVADLLTRLVKTVQRTGARSPMATKAFVGSKIPRNKAVYEIANDLGANLPKPGARGGDRAALAKLLREGRAVLKGNWARNPQDLL